MSLSGLGLVGWLALAVAALLVGVAKTAVGGVAMISVALFAAVLPARPSSGALLLLLLVGDAVAVGTYRRHADWSTLARLWPSVLVGIICGAIFVRLTGDTTIRRTIGAVLVVLVAVQFFTARSRVAEPAPSGRVITAGAGVLAGFTSMVANAGGAVMTVYLLRARSSVLTFLGTAAWFFLSVNLVKVPFSAALGLLPAASFVLVAVLSPLVLVGGVLGRRIVPRLSVERFERIVLGFTALAALNLLR